MSISPESNHEHSGGSGDGKKIKAANILGLMSFVQENGGGDSFVGDASKSSGSTGSQAITGAGFQPSIVLIFAVYASTPGSFSVGYGKTGASEFCLYTYDVSGSASWSYSGSDIIQVLDSGGTNEARAQLSSLDSDGFTLNWSKADVRTDFFYLCLS